VAAGPGTRRYVAAPDPPLRVLAPEPLKFAILVVPAVAGVPGGRRLTVGAAGPAAGRAGCAMELPASLGICDTARLRSPVRPGAGPGEAAGRGLRRVAGVRAAGAGAGAVAGYQRWW